MITEIIYKIDESEVCKLKDQQLSQGNYGFEDCTDVFISEGYMYLIQHYEERNNDIFAVEESIHPEMHYPKCVADIPARGIVRVTYENMEELPIYNN